MEAALLAAICAQPEDISARLVFADYLLEQSEQEKRDRGEFILAQCRLADGRLDRAERDAYRVRVEECRTRNYNLPPFRGSVEGALQTRVKELLLLHWEAWTAPLRGMCDLNWGFHRGFLERLTMTAEQFAVAFREVSRVTPVVRVHLLTAGQPLDHVAALPELNGVIGLDLSGEHVTPAGLRGLLASPHLTRLKYLNLSRNSLGDAGCEALAESPVLPRLTQLSLARTELTPAGVSRLMSRITSGPSALRWLNLRHNSLSPGTWADTVLGWLPPRTPAALRLSLEGQLGRYRLTKPEPAVGPLPRLKASKTLNPEMAAWVKALDISQPAQLVAVLRGNALPADVQRAFVVMCGRRLEWAVRRFDPKNAVPPLPAATDPKALADLVQVVLHTVRQPTTGHAMWLRDWLLRFLEQHAAGILDAEGRTR